MSRPFARLSLDDLKELARTEPAKVADIKGELAHRRTSGAKAFLRSLNAGDRDGSTSGERAQAGDDLAQVDALPAGVARPPKSRDLEQRYELLRATFTIEGEILARWGMTSSLPSDLQGHIFAIWRERTSETPDGHGRTRASLEADVELLAREGDTLIEGQVRGGP